MKIIKKIKRFSKKYRAHEKEVAKLEAERMETRLQMVTMVAATSVQMVAIAAQPREKKESGNFIVPNVNTGERAVTMVELTALSTAISKQDFMQKLVAMPSSIFKNENNRQFFEAIKELSESNEIVDMSMVLGHYKVKNKEIHNDYIEKILKTEISLNPTGLLKKIKEQDGIEKGLKDIVDLYNSVKSGNLDIDHFIEKIQNLKTTDDIDQSGELSDFFGKPIDEVFTKTDFIKTGLNILDEYILGFGKGQLICIAGVPGSGKSTLGFQFACHINSVFVSMEMTRKQLYAKYLSSKASVETFQLYKNRLTEKEYNRVLKAQSNHNSLRVRVCDRSSNLYWILNKIRDEVKNNGKELAVIDYIQLVTDAPGFNKTDKLEYTTRALKELAMELQITIIMLSQLVKSVVSENRKPNGGDLRSSGSIYQDSDVVLFPYETPEGESIIIIEKCREGKTGDLQNINFIKPYCRFEEIKIKTKFDDLPANGGGF